MEVATQLQINSKTICHGIAVLAYRFFGCSTAVKPVFHHAEFCARIRASFSSWWKTVFIIYQSSKFSLLCVSLVESVSRKIDEIRLSPSHQRARKTMHYSPVNHRRPKNVGKFCALQARAAAYCLQTIRCLALAVHKIFRHFWAAYG